MLIKSAYQTKEFISEDLISRSFNGYDKFSSRQVLIWIAKPEYLTPKLVQRLIPIAERLITLKHEHVLPMIDYDYDGRSLSLFYDCPNQLISLDAYLNAKGHLSQEIINKLINQLLVTMVWLEDHGIVCGTLHPSHIFVNATVDIYVSNIAIASAIYRDNVHNLEVIDEGVCIAPEFLTHRRLTVQSDIYSFSAIVYHLLSRKWPYPMKTAILKLKKQWLNPPLALSKTVTVSAAFDDLIMRCLSINEADRMPSFRAFRQVMIDKQIRQPDPSETPDTDPVAHQLAKDVRHEKNKVTRSWTTRVAWIMSIVISLSVASWLYNNYFSAIAELTIPNVVGINEEQAITVLAEYQLSSHVIGRRFHPFVPSGAVIESIPPAGRAVKQKRPIQLMISSGPEPVLIPSLIFKSLNQAQELADQVGVSLNIGEPVYSSVVPEGVVVHQIPSANILLPKESVITVNMSIGFPVDITVTENANYRGFSDIKQVQISGVIPPTWPTQSITIKATYFNLTDVIYSASHPPSSNYIVKKTVDVGTVIDVLFNGDTVQSMTIKTQ